MPFASDTMIKTITDALDDLRPIVVRIEKLKVTLKKSDSDNAALSVAKPIEAEFHRLDEISKKMSSKVTTEDKYKVARKDTTTLVSGKKKFDARELLLKNEIEAHAAWTVTTTDKVTKWINKRSAGGQFDKVVDEIEKIGASKAVGGLRHISGNTWDWHVPGAGDYRVVGLADPGDHTMAFSGVYNHPSSGGKELVAGSAVPGY